MKKIRTEIVSVNLSASRCVFYVRVVVDVILVGPYVEALVLFIFCAENT